MYYVVVFFFFFKQKTAYEMRISDWSSDVCSSDLPAEAERQIRVVRIGPVRGPDLQPADRNRKQARPADIGDRVDEAAGAATGPGIGAGRTGQRQPEACKQARSEATKRFHGRAPCREGKATSLTSSTRPRSEEQPSELQSLIRISDSVFCLKKKKSYE